MTSHDESVRFDLDDTSDPCRRYTRAGLDAADDGIDRLEGLPRAVRAGRAPGVGTVGRRRHGGNDVR